MPLVRPELVERATPLSIATTAEAARRNVTLYPWFKACQNLIFWQAVWFLFFQARLSPAEAILLYAVYDVATTVLEVPSGYLSDRIGRRITLILAGLCSLVSAVLLVLGDGFAAYALANVFLGAGAAFGSGTDSALLYESLKADRRGSEIEAQELKAWRFTFVALAVSAVAGGALTVVDDLLPYVATALAFAGMLVVSLGFREVGPMADSGAAHRPSVSLRVGFVAAMAQPVVCWLFALSVLMYGFSHIPFVFGQPVILSALSAVGLASEVPLVSGAVTATMMAVSVATSLFASGLRRRIGLARILLLAFGMQVALVAALALSNALFVIGLLLLRMVPDSLSRPFILARIQPLLADGTRATVLSLQSFCGRLLFATTLGAAAMVAGPSEQMAHAELRVVLGTYAVAGLACLLALALAARRVPLDDRA